MEDKKWCFSWDGEDFNGYFDTRKEAIAEARATNEEAEFVYIGAGQRYKEECSRVAEVVSEYLADMAWDEVGNYAYEYMYLKAKHEEILEERLKTTILEFQKAFGYEPTFYPVKDVECVYLRGGKRNETTRTKDL